MRYQIAITILVAVLSIFITAVASGEDFDEYLDKIENRAQRLLKPQHIADAKTQLSKRDKHLLGIEDIRFVPATANCAAVISDAVDAWQAKYRITAKKQETKGPDMVVEVETLEPVHGSLIVIYRFLSKNLHAYVKYLFDSSVRINPLQREQLIMKYHVVELKTSLNEKMECQRNGAVKDQNVK